MWRWVKQKTEDTSSSVFNLDPWCCGDDGDVCAVGEARCPVGYQCGITGFLKGLMLKLMCRNTWNCLETSSSVTFVSYSFVSTRHYTVSPLPTTHWMFYSPPPGPCPHSFYCVLCLLRCVSDHNRLCTVRVDARVCLHFGARAGLQVSRQHDKERVAISESKPSSFPSRFLHFILRSPAANWPPLSSTW